VENEIDENFKDGLEFYTVFPAFMFLFELREIFVLAES
jgi:hypothetical protein